MSGTACSRALAEWLESQAAKRILSGATSGPGLRARVIEAFEAGFVHGLHVEPAAPEPEPVPLFTRMGLPEVAWPFPSPRYAKAKGGTPQPAGTVSPSVPGPDCIEAGD